VSGFVDVQRPPDAVRVFGADGEIAVHPTPDGLWSGDGVVVGLAVEPDRIGVRLSATTGVARLALRWRGDPGDDVRYLGDHWERSYGDLEWRGDTAERVLPWMLLAHRPRAGAVTHGYGVRVRPGALCFWTADRGGLTLWADVRSGGRPVQLRGRVLSVADVVGRRGEPGEGAVAAQRALCRLLCDDPLMPPHPVVGTNDWHVHYGRADARVILDTARQLVEWSPDGTRPYCVIDDGWSQGGLGVGPWYGNERFGDMGALAGRMRDAGARPGIWYRPLTAVPGASRPSRGGPRLLRDGVLDPSVPEVLASVGEHVRRLVDWGYELVKHDFTTWDVLGRWGFAMGATVTDDGWGFARDDLTTAEVLLDLYRTVRGAAGPALLIGCNTIGHLAAGLVELQRIGDDTSGVSWNRTRRMGVNALAFRAAQHGTFFAVDADVTPVTPHLPWPLARGWLDLVADSGTPLFVSVDPDVDDPAVLAAVRDAVARAARAHRAAGPVAEPLDWFDTRCPRRWRVDGADRTVDWSGADGPWPFAD